MKSYHDEAIQYLILQNKKLTLFDMTTKTPTRKGVNERLLPSPTKESITLANKGKYDLETYHSKSSRMHGQLVMLIARS